jgi:protein-S-isoprenylcysteine O-methyltransferase Ste14
MKPRAAEYITFIVLTTVVLPLIVYRLLVKFPHDLLTCAGLGIFIPSFLLLIIAFFQLGTSFTVTPKAKELVTTGIYSKIRHPIYFFQQSLSVGFALVLHDSVLMYLFCLLLLARNVWRARQENRILEEKFGNAYRAYRDRVWF